MFIKTEGIIMQTTTKKSYFGLLLMLLAAGCSNPIDHRHSNGIILVNETNDLLFYQVWERESTNLVDIAPRFEVGPDQEDQLLPSGKTATVLWQDVQGGYQIGDAVRIFLYKVVNDTATAAGIITRTYVELRESHFEVSIKEESGGTINAQNPVSQESIMQ